MTQAGNSSCSAGGHVTFINNQSRSVPADVLHPEITDSNRVRGNVEHFRFPDHHGSAFYAFLLFFYFIKNVFQTWSIIVHHYKSLHPALGQPGFLALDLQVQEGNPPSRLQLLPEDPQVFPGQGAWMNCFLVFTSEGWTHMWKWWTKQFIVGKPEEFIFQWLKLGFKVHLNSDLVASKSLTVVNENNQFIPELVKMNKLEVLRNPWSLYLGCSSWYFQLGTQKWQLSCTNWSSAMPPVKSELLPGSDSSGPPSWGLDLNRKFSLYFSVQHLLHHNRPKQQPRYCRGCMSTSCHRMSDSSSPPALGCREHFKCLGFSCTQIIIILHDGMMLACLGFTGFWVNSGSGVQHWAVNLHQVLFKPKPNKTIKQVYFPKSHVASLSGMTSFQSGSLELFKAELVKLFVYFCCEMKQITESL